MSEPLSKEQLDAIRARVANLDAASARADAARRAYQAELSRYDTKMAFLDALSDRDAWRDALESYADEDIPALLAHIDALEAALAAAISDGEPV